MPSGTPTTCWSSPMSSWWSTPTSYSSPGSGTRRRHGCI
uniref:Uncharacterized protein n=1 Tax=Arundo donax TaxID=35708 RepID=A0A0A9GQC1_ARUDO